MDCIFCKIIEKKLPSYKIYEDKYSYAMLDISNDANGHILVIPKKHYENILDCDETILKQLSLTVQRIAKHLVEDCGFDGVNILNANGKSAEQSVFHFHIHIIPRKEGDEIKVFPSLKKNEESLEEICERLRINQ